MGQAKLLIDRRFLAFFLTQFLGAFNDNFLKNALVILIAFKSLNFFGLNPEQMVPLAGGIFILPFFLFSATAGQIADKYEKSKLIRIIKTVEILIMIVAASGFIFKQYILIFLALFLMGVHSTFFGPIKYSILPQLLKEEDLVGGNALVEAGTFLAILIGTVAGGYFISVPENGVFKVGGGLIFFAILGWFASREIPLAPSGSDIKIQLNPITPTWETFKFARKNKTIYNSILGISWFWFFGAAILSLLPTYGKIILQISENGVTFFLALFSIGIGLGSFVCGVLSKKRLELGLVPIGSFGISLFTLDLSWTNKSALVHISFDLLMIAVFSGLFIVPLYTLIQERAQAAYRSRIVAANNILNAFFMVLAALLLVFLSSRKVTIPQTFAVLALMNAAVATYIFLLIPEFVMRFIVWILANVVYRIKTTGLENIPKEGPAILVCNHVSFVDWVIISAEIPRPIRFIMDHNYASGFFVRFLLRQAKVILIAPAHENVDLMEEAFKKAALELKDDQLLGIFPEGKLTSTGEMNPFKAGIDRVLQDTPIQVIPMAVRGLWGSSFSRKIGSPRRLRRIWSPIELKIGEPVDPRDATKEYLFQRVHDLRGDSR